MYPANSVKSEDSKNKGLSQVATFPQVWVIIRLSYTCQDFMKRYRGVTGLSILRYTEGIACDTDVLVQIADIV